MTAGTGAAEWLVHSREHNAFWRPNAAGYTNNMAEAGRFAREKAEKYCNRRDPQRDGSASEFCFPAPPW